MRFGSINICKIWIYLKTTGLTNSNNLMSKHPPQPTWTGKEINQKDKRYIDLQ
jgi:hypothetical protein